MRPAVLVAIPAFLAPHALLATLPACGETRPLQPGVYVFAHVYSRGVEATAAPELAGAELEIWDDLSGIELRVAGQEPVTIALQAPRPEEAWWDYCPTQWGSTMLEIRDVAAEDLRVGSWTLGSPVLTTDCGDGVTLAEDGPIEPEYPWISFEPEGGAVADTAP